MAKLKLRELEDRLYWLNEGMESFKNGYSEYLLSKYMDSDMQEPLNILTSIMWTAADGDPEKDITIQYACDFCNYISEYDEYENVVITKHHDYKKMMKRLVNNYAMELINKQTRKKDKKEFLSNYMAYYEFYENIKL